MSFPTYYQKEPEAHPANTSSVLPQIVRVSGAAPPGEHFQSTRNTSNNSPPPIGHTIEKEGALAPSYASPAWYFFGVPGGSSNLQRELKVYCLLCKVQVKRGTNPGKLGTTCLFAHLERRHNLTREEVFEAAAAAGYCGPIITPSSTTSTTSYPTTAPVSIATSTPSASSTPTPTTTNKSAIQTWKCSNDDGGFVLIPVKRSGMSLTDQDEDGHAPKRQATMAPATSSQIPDFAKCQTTTAPATSSEPVETLNMAPYLPAAASKTFLGSSGMHDLSKCQSLTAPATSSGASETDSLSTPHSGRRHHFSSQTRAMPNSYRQALRDRLLSSVHMYCEVCHTLILSGERSQNARDLALETHFSSQHPHMYNRLKRGAARDARLGSLGPSSALPSASISGNVPPSSSPC